MQHLFGREHVLNNPLRGRQFTEHIKFIPISFINPRVNNARPAQSNFQILHMMNFLALIV